MGARGPQPLSPAQFRLTQPLQPGSRTAVQPRGAIERPLELSIGAREHWDEIVPALEGAGLVASWDASELAELMEDMALLDRIRYQLDDAAPLICENPTTGAVRKNPLLTVLHEVTMRVNARCRQFGMTPSGRINLGPVKEADTLDEGHFGASA